MTQNSIAYMQIRGGSSKGIYFFKSDLPEDEDLRNKIILDVVGRDKRQIDGLGGAHPLTSKVAIVSKSNDTKSDIDFMFVQVVAGENRVDTTPNCGNILSGVGVFALENNMIQAKSNTTSIVVKMLNSNTFCELIMQTPNGELTYEGNTKIDGVLGTSAPIICNYLDTQGAICGELFPTKNKKDVIVGCEVTCIDNGMPVVLLKASDFNKSGYESCEELEKDQEFRRLLESIRIKAGILMMLGDVTQKVIPKMTLISPPKNGGTINTRTFIPHNCHASIGVLGAVSVASACLYEDSVTADIAIVNDKENITVEHPSGKFLVKVQSEKNTQDITLKSAGIVRTARLISKGRVYLPPTKESS